MTKQKVIEEEFQLLGGELMALPYPENETDAGDSTIPNDIRCLIERFENLIALSLREGYWGGKEYSHFEIVGILEMRYRRRLNIREVKEKIRKAIHDCLHSTGEPEENNNLYLFIEDAGFSVRTSNLLNHFMLVEQLTRMTKRDLLNIRRFGRKALYEVEARLAELGLKLKDPSPPKTIEVDD